MHEIEYYDAELNMSSWLVNGEWYWDKPNSTTVDMVGVGDAVVYRLNGGFHREGGPAIEYSDGHKEWWLDGKWNREDGPAIEYSDGTKQWIVNDEYHRIDGPAIEYASGGKEWFVNGDYHRLDGPAIEYAGGGKEWYLDDVRYTEEEYLEQCKK